MKTKKPTKKVRSFILKKLIPFIMREQGRGFGMNGWLAEDIDVSTINRDDITRPTPPCNTVACIGGSIEFLTDYRHRDAEKLGKLLGLSALEANGLFYQWDDSNNGGGVQRQYRWPTSFQNRFARVKTTRGKAAVACDLLRKIANEGGACLHRSES